MRQLSSSHTTVVPVNRSPELPRHSCRTHTQTWQPGATIDNHPGGAKGRRHGPAHTQQTTPLQGSVSQSTIVPPPNPLWTFLTTSPYDNGVHDVMSGFLQGLGYVAKPPQMRHNANYNRGYLVGAMVNVGTMFVPLRLSAQPPGVWEPPTRPRTTTTATVPLPSRGPLERAAGRHVTRRFAWRGPRATVRGGR